MLYLLLTACEPDSMPTLGAATFEASSDNMAAKIWFHSDSAGEGRVEVQLNDEPVRSFRATSDDGEAFEADVAGLVAGAEYRWRAVVSTEDGERATPWGTWRTPSPPQDMPTAFVTLASESETLFLTTQVAPVSRSVAMDASGRTLWWNDADPNERIWQARLAAAGEGVLELVQLVDDSTDVASVLRYVPLFGGEGFELRVGAAHHDFVELAEDRWAFVQLDIREVDGVDIAGDRVVVMGQDGSERVLWSSWDWLENPTALVIEGGGTMEWTHANALAYDVERDIFWLSLHSLSTVVAIDGATGDTLGLFGGDVGDHTLMAGSPYRYQHGLSATADGFLLFDNGDLGAESPSSRAAEFTVDFEAGTYTEVWSWGGESPIFAPFLGNVSKTPEGGLSVNWGAAGRHTELDENLEMSGQVDFELGAVLSFSHPISRLGPTP